MAYIVPMHVKPKFTDLLDGDLLFLHVAGAESAIFHEEPWFN